ncbi:hypothetical protein D3C84_1049310 [compost metagenome]
MSDIVRERNRQTAARIVIAEQHVGNTGAALDAKMPCLYDCIRILRQPRQRKRSAAQEHGYDRLAKRSDLFDQPALSARQVKACAGTGFAAHLK